ncbi:hypothetical protein [Streptomyces xinghaiensis]|uniref:hypothetical protein n=1 Tax=Streptomyces xinghaiensis TaxID=1038928 RepID=UPI001864D0A8|nr:hypothetical protein [Streptomyces xinghaiensis]
MRRTTLVLPVLVTALLGTAPPATAASGPGPAAGAPAAAASAVQGTRWEPAPSAPWDVPAGARCDFPVHGEPVVDEVVRRVLETRPDGSAKRVAYKGDLVIRVTNQETGASYDADASGTAVVEYRTDGSQFWTVLGPVLVGVGENGGNLARGLYIVDGAYTLEIGPAGYKTVTMAAGTTDDLCARIG